MQPSDPQYDFILKGDQQAATPQNQPDPGQGKFFLPKKAIFAGAGVLLLLLIGLIVFSSLSKNSGPTDQVVAVMATAQEIARVSDLVAQKTKDVGTLGLTATTSTTMLSQQGEIAGYIAKAGIKYDPKQIGLYQDTKIDADLATAEQNNAVEVTYYEFLKTKLADYQRRLQALSSTKSKTLLAILETAYNSTKTLLTAPQLAQK